MTETVRRVVASSQEPQVSDRLAHWFAGGWLVVALNWVYLEATFAYTTAQDWVIQFGCFMLLEIIGALRTKDGDTFSEMVWAFVGGGSSRRWVGYGLAVALTFRLFTLPGIFAGHYGYLTNPAAVVPWAALSIAVGLWLADHFPNLGENG